MMTEEPLADLFCRHLPEGVVRPDRQDPALERWLAAALRQAGEQWPEVALSAEEFLPFLAARIPPDSGAALPILQALLVEKLYLVCACLHGDLRAVEHLRRCSSPELAGAVRQLAEEGALAADEVMQLVGDERDPEQQATELLSRGELAEALGRALTTLSSQQRNVLRYRLIEGLTLDQIGGQFEVQCRTVTRWIAAIRQQLLEETRRHLSARPGADQDEVEGSVRALQRQLEASVRRRIVDP